MHLMIPRPTPAARLAAVLILFLLPSLAPAAEIELWLDPAREDCELSFRSKATLESFEGKSGALTGWLRFDEDDTAQLTGELELELASLDTGLGLRNKHMREQVLHTDEHPLARLVLRSARLESGPGLRPGQRSKAAVQAELELHGVRRDVEIETEIERSADGHSLGIEARFSVMLKDHGIERPRMLMMKVAEEIKLSVRATAHDRAPVRRDGTEH